MDIDKTEGSYLAKTNHGTREKYAIKASKLGQKNRWFDFCFRHGIYLFYTDKRRITG